MTLWKAHHGIMKADAIADYNRVKALCEQEKKPIHKPKGKSWQKIEDATTLMIQQFNRFPVGFTLFRGISYYLTFNQEEGK